MKYFSITAKDIKENPLSNTLLNGLQKYGVAVIKNVIDEETAIRLADQIKFIPGIENFQKTNGIIKQYKVGHWQPVWIARLLTEFVWRNLWDNRVHKGLITSFDGIGFQSKKKIHKQNWFHTDEQRGRPNETYQGSLQVSKRQEGNQGFAFIPPDLVDHKDWDDGSHFNVLPQEEQNKNIWIVPKVDIGDMLIWNSKIFHQNIPNPEPNYERIVIFICMVPRVRLNNNNANKRLKYFKERRTTSHWPHTVRVNSLQPQHYGDRSKIIDYDRLDVPMIDSCEEWICEHLV
jgi:hypothetical protein